MEAENSENSVQHQLERQLEELLHFHKTSEDGPRDGHIVFEMSKICRICLLERNDLKSLFDEEPNCISDMIMTFVPIQLTPDDCLPSNICMQCESQVSRAVTIKQQIEIADATLRNFIAVGSLDIKIQAVEEVESFPDKKHQHTTEDNGSVIQENLYIEKNNQAIVYEITGNHNEHTDDIFDHVNEEECEFVEEDFNQRDSNNENEIVSSGRVSKRNIDRKMKLKNKKKEDSPAAWICQICDKEFSDIRRYNRHKKIHDDEKQYRCQTCHKGFNERADLNRHVERHIKSQEVADDQSFNCNECHISFKVQSDLNIHQSIHRNDGKIICGECSKEFSTKIQLKRHVRIHYLDKPHKCSVCLKGFPEMGSLTRHFKKHTGEVREKKFECITCGKRYFDIHSLRVHNRKHSGEKPWTCITCGKSFIDLRLLNSHKKIHMDIKPHICRYCDRRFTHQSTLTTHLRTHTNEKPYICSFCGKTFIQSSSLSLHIRVHTGEKPYKCSICQRCFASSSTLTMHHRVHSGEKPYQCSVCNKSFARHDLSAHMRTHTGEKPFLCTTCKKRFTTSGQLNQHARTHSGEKPYVCDRCNKACSSSTYLKKHKQNCRLDLQLQHQDEYVEVRSTQENQMPESDSLTLQEVSEHTDTYYVRIDGNQLIHEIINQPINEHNLIHLNETGDGEEILDDMIAQNEMSDNIGMHIEGKHIYQTIPNCMGIQINSSHTEDERTNVGNEQYFIGSKVINK